MVFFFGMTLILSESTERKPGRSRSKKGADGKEVIRDMSFISKGILAKRRSRIPPTSPNWRLKGNLQEIRVTELTSKLKLWWMRCRRHLEDPGPFGLVTCEGSRRMSLWRT